MEDGVSRGFGGRCFEAPGPPHPLCSCLAAWACPHDFIAGKRRVQPGQERKQARNWQEKGVCQAHEGQAWRERQAGMTPVVPQCTAWHGHPRGSPDESPSPKQRLWPPIQKWPLLPKRHGGSASPCSEGRRGEPLPPCPSLPASPLSCPTDRKLLFTPPQSLIGLPSCFLFIRKEQGGTSAKGGRARLERHAGPRLSEGHSGLRCPQHACSGEGEEAQPRNGSVRGAD